MNPVIKTCYLVSRSDPEKFLMLNSRADPEAPRHLRPTAWQVDIGQRAIIRFQA
jgi:hypothetical protein